MKLQEISVIITTRDDGTSLARCLDSLKGFGEVFVVDGMSTDDTVTVARSRRAVVFSRPITDAAAQKNWALGRARNRWVLSVEPDEMISPGLRRAIECLEDEPRWYGFVVHRTNHYLGRRMRHSGWSGENVLRLFKRPHGRFENGAVEANGARVALQGPVTKLRGELERFPFETVERHLDAIESSSMRRGGRLAAGGGWRLIAGMVVRPPLEFLKRYVAYLGFLDGSRGFLFCLLSSYGIFVSYARAWEIWWREGSGERRPGVSEAGAGEAGRGEAGARTADKI